MNPAYLQDSLFWILSASFLGFAISAIFSGWLKFSRNIFLVPYLLLVTLFLLVFFTWDEQMNRELWFHNWYWGIAAALLAGVFLLKNIRSQPRSQHKRGIRLWKEIIWAGIAYGIMDGLFLNVFPVVAVRNVFSSAIESGGLEKEILTGLAGLLASLVITFFYHIGYSEFRNSSIFLVLLGNTIITLTFVLSGNPMAALACHAFMHVAAVVRGPETTLQLPPHYRAKFLSVT